jgi:tetratricopeptide (TPR) repeat protein
MRPLSKGGGRNLRHREDICMNRFAALMALALLAGAGFAQTPVATETKLSPAQLSMERAQKLIDRKPQDFEAYNALALALSRRARETSDVTYYTRAEEALKKSYAISPDNFDGKRIGVWLLLGKHEFPAAREQALLLNKKMKDDVMVYGFLTDANVELGNYREAEEACQWMLDLKPANSPAVTRAAYLRELFGDPEGAIDLMNMALESTPPFELEDRAWITTQLAHLKLTMGKLDESEKLSEQALTLFPGYHYALQNLAKVKIQQGRYSEAVDLLQQRYNAAPHAENEFELAVAMRLAGRTEDAKKAFADFERRSLAETNIGDNSNHELIFYYADEANEPAKALEVARREMARRHDVFTTDEYAWALFKNGQYAEARKQIDAALEVGIQDARMLRHAGEIAGKQGDRKAAVDYLNRAAALNTVESVRAKMLLGELSVQMSSVERGR